MARKSKTDGARARVKIDEVVTYWHKIGRSWVGGTARVLAVDEATGTATLRFVDGNTLTDVPLAKIVSPPTVNMRDTDALFPELRPIKVTVEFLVYPARYDNPANLTPGGLATRLVSRLVADVVGDLRGNFEHVRVAGAEALAMDAAIDWHNAPTIHGGLTHPGTDARALAYPGFVGALTVVDDDGPTDPGVVRSAWTDQLDPIRRRILLAQDAPDGHEPLTYYHDPLTGAYIDLGGPYEGDQGRYFLIRKITVPVGERGKGIASALLSIVLDDADDQGVTLCLEVGKDRSDGALKNDSLAAWYGRHGFTQDFPGQYGVPVGRWMMTRKPQGGQS